MQHFQKSVYSTWEAFITHLLHEHATYQVHFWDPETQQSLQQSEEKGHDARAVSQSDVRAYDILYIIPNKVLLKMVSKINKLCPSSGWG